MRRNRRMKRPSGPPAALNQYEEDFARKKVDDLELAMVNTMVDKPFTAREVLGWLWPEDVITTLTAARAMAYYDYSSVTAEKQFDGNIVVRFHCELKHLGMISPKEELLLPWGLDSAPLLAALQRMHKIHLQFNAIRRCISWLQQNATAGAIKYYWPAILSLLPAETAVHKSDGERYREPEGIGAHVPVFRATSGTIASALLLPEYPKPENLSFHVRVGGSNLFPLV